MNEISEQGIKKLIETYTKTYVDNPSMMMSGYRQELQTVADYEGRQLLELLQNADDAGSDVVKIVLDREKRILSVSNNGEPFSVDGVESLMYTGLSTKNKQEYIGNKGLGFRSVLNWAHWVEIRTRNVSFRFSDDYSKKYFNDNLLSNISIKERVEKEILEKKIRKDEIPIATLAFPEMVNSVETSFVTSVIVHFKETDLPKILEQLKGVAEETLLFLPHIKEIILVDGTEIRILKKNIEDGNLQINDAHWNIINVKDQVYNDNLKYNFSIAWQNEGFENARFYNYFPTDVYTYLPSIIHATFDLTGNRKEINKNEANKHILKHIAKQLCEIASEKLKKQFANWDAYNFLTPKEHNNRDVLNDFYKLISEQREFVEVYPTVNNKYLNLSDTFYCGEAFSVWVEENDFGEYFPGLLKSNVPEMVMKNFKKYTFEDLNKIVESINSILNISQRSEFIAHIVRNAGGSFDAVFKQSSYLPLLLDSNGTPARSDVQVFTKEAQESDFDLPEYIDDVAFISHELYRKICDELREEIDEKRLENENGDSRALKRLLSPVVNIGSNDITDVIQHIVKQTNLKIEASEEAITLVKKMVQGLFSIYITNPSRRGNLNSIISIPLISRSYKITSSSDLYFGKGYDLGRSSEIIFDGIRNDDDYLIDNNFWELDSDDDTVCNFFKWLNINVLSKYSEINRSFGRWESDQYVDFVIKKISNQRTDVYKTYKVEEIKGFNEMLSTLSVEKLVAWIAKDEKFQEKLKVINSEIFTVEYNREYKSISEKPSYIFFQIQNSGILKNVILSSPLEDLESLTFLDVSHQLFKDLNIAEYKIREIADLLGIKDSFNSLNPDIVYSLLKNYSDHDSTNSQQFYKLVYEYFRSNEKTQLVDYIPNLEGQKYFCRRGGSGKDVFISNINEVYYSDNKLLPQKILDQYTFINLPKRIGENRVKKFFGIRLIKDVIAEIDIILPQPNRLEEEFNKYFNQLKPLFLAYRLETLQKKDEKEDAARTIKAMNIKLLKKASFLIAGGNKISFENNDLINKGNDFFICSYNESSLLSLKTDPIFCDIIAEAICIVFKVNDNKNVFRRIFKDGLSESLHILKVDEKEEILNEAKQLLGVSIEEQLFWSKLIGKEVVLIDDSETLNKKIEDFMGESLPEFYKQVNFSNLASESGILFLDWTERKRPGALKKTLNSETLKEYHIEKLNNVVKDHVNSFEKLLWFKVEKSISKHQKEKYFENTLKFADLVKYMNDDFFIENAFCLTPDYFAAINKITIELFEIDLNETLEQPIDIKTKYKNIISKFTFGDSVEDMENIIGNANPDLYSLMFFENYDYEIIAACELQQQLLSEKITASENEKNEEENILNIVESNMIADHSISNHSGSILNSRGKHTSNIDRNKALIGKKQEVRVKQALQKAGYEVNDVSSKTDGKHYDLEYKKEGEDVWRYLEVKNDSGGFFYLSKWEKEAAMANGMSSKYDIALVDNEKINLIKSPFLFDDETFENNKIFTAEATEYKISFKLQKLDF